MNYGILYTQTVFPKGHRYEWLRFCNLTNILPLDLKQATKALSDRINSEFSDSIVVKMDNSIFPGCVTTPDKIEEVAQAIYDGMSEIFRKLKVDDNCIRLVYGVGEIEEKWMTKVKSAHEIGSFPIMIKIGRTLDSAKTPGIINVNNS